MDVVRGRVEEEVMDRAPWCEDEEDVCPALLLPSSKDDDDGWSDVLLEEVVTRGKS